VPDVRAVAFGALPHLPVHVRAGMLGGHAAARRDDALGLRLAAAAPVSPSDADGTDPCLLAAADLTGPTRSAQRSANGTLADVTHRQHAATATISVTYQRSDPVGRRLLGESPWVPWRRGVI